MSKKHILRAPQTDRYLLTVPCSAADLDCTNQASVLDNVTRAVEAGTPTFIGGTVSEDPKGIITTGPLTVRPKIAGLYQFVVTVIWDLALPFADRTHAINILKNGAAFTVKADSVRMGGGHTQQAVFVARAVPGDAFTFQVTVAANANFIASSLYVFQVAP